MSKDNKRALIITSIVTILPVFIGVFFWNRLPDMMATHFGTNGEADGYSSKAFAVFGLPLILLAVEWICALFMSKDPKKQNIGSKVFAFVLWLIPVTSLAVAAIMYSYNLGCKMDITLVVAVLIGVLFIVVGNYLPKTGQNHTFGIRVPWTLASEDNWNRTHKFAGSLWVIGGMITVILALTGIVKAAWLIAIFLVLALAPCIYSYLLHVKHKAQ